MLGVLLAAAIVALPMAARAADTDIVTGQCIKGSHIAAGGVDEDLSKRETPFSCDRAVITFLDQESKHVMVQFAMHSADHAMQLGFAGELEDNGQILDVDHVYIGTGSTDPLVPVGGQCNFFFKDTHMTRMICGARIEQGGKATVPVVAFEADPGQ
jgi:hypothetical protein